MLSGDTLTKQNAKKRFVLSKIIIKNVSYIIDDFNSKN